MNAMVPPKSLVSSIITSNPKRQPPSSINVPIKLCGSPVILGFHTSIMRWTLSVTSLSSTPRLKHYADLMVTHRSTRGYHRARRWLEPETPADDAIHSLPFQIQVLEYSLIHLLSELRSIYLPLNSSSVFPLVSGIRVEVKTPSNLRSDKLILNVHKERENLHDMVHECIWAAIVSQRPNERLRYDCPHLSRSGADTMSCRPIPGGKTLAGNDKGSRVRAKI